jgi:hypothetical protein
VPPGQTLSWTQAAGGLETVLSALFQLASGQPSIFAAEAWSLLQALSS